MKRIAYIRVSTLEQSIDRQIDALEHLSDEVHIERISAVSKSRPVYDRVMRKLKSGDIFIILELDRAYRSTQDALRELDRLHARNVSIYIANLSIDTSTPYGVLIYTIVSALAEFERKLLSQRTKEGLKAAKARGKILGRPRTLTTRQLKNAAKRLAMEGESLNTVAKRYGIAAWSLSRALKREGIEWQG